MLCPIHCPNVQCQKVWLKTLLYKTTGHYLVARKDGKTKLGDYKEKGATFTVESNVLPHQPKKFALKSIYAKYLVAQSGSIRVDSNVIYDMALFTDEHTKTAHCFYGTRTNIKNSHDGSALGTNIEWKLECAMGTLQLLKYFSKLGYCHLTFRYIDTYLHA